MRPLASMLCLAALIGAAPATAQTAAPDAADGAGTVEVELREGGRLVGSPSLRVQVGQAASVSVGGSYSLRLRLDRAAAGEGPAPYVMRSSFSRSEAGSARIAAPALPLSRGEPARMRFAGADGSDLSIAVILR